MSKIVIFLTHLMHENVDCVSEEETLEYLAHCPLIPQTCSISDLSSRKNIATETVQFWKSHVLKFANIIIYASYKK